MVIAAIDAVLGAYGRIDGLVNNAGGQYRAPMKSISTKGFEAVVRSNLTGGVLFFCEVYNTRGGGKGGGVGHHNLCNRPYLAPGPPPRRAAGGRPRPPPNHPRD